MFMKIKISELDLKYIFICVYIVNFTKFVFMISQSDAIHFVNVIVLNITELIPF